MADRVRAGVVGCGAISGAYLSMARNFPVLEIAACADLVPEAARCKAEEWGVARTCSVDELLADESLDVILNLTVPNAHAAVALAAIEAGKHTYCEKPLATTRDDGRRVLEAARRRGVRVGCAPDTFL